MGRTARHAALALLAAAGAACIGLPAGCATAARQPPARNSPAADPAGPVLEQGPSSGAGHGNTCTAPPSRPRGSCSGCSVSCDDKQAACTAGEEWAGGSGSGSCLKSAVCECR